MCVKQLFALAGSATISTRLAAESASTNAGLIIDAHCHAGKGTEMSAPWSTYADPKVTLRRATEAWIDKTIIFPINNLTFEKANLEIAEIAKQYPEKFIGFAKHDPV